MKKRIIIALAAAILLTAGTVVYAVTAPSPEQSAQTPAAQQNPVGAWRAKSSEKQEAPVPDTQTEAGRILQEALSKKDMTDEEIIYYSLTPDDIKSLTYQQARELEQQYSALVFDESLPPMNEMTPEQLAAHTENVQLYIDYRNYADSIATGEPLFQKKYAEMKNYYEQSLRIGQEFLDRYYSTYTQEELDSIFYKPSVLFAKHRITRGNLVRDILAVIDGYQDAGVYSINRLTDDLQVLREYLDTESSQYAGREKDTAANYDFILDAYKTGKSIREILG